MNIVETAARCYNNGSATRNGRRLALHIPEGEPSEYIKIPEMESGKEGMLMITLSELIQFTGLLISIATLFYAIGKNNGKKK